MSCVLASCLWLACVNNVKCCNAGWCTTPRHCQCQPANIAKVNQLYANCMLITEGLENRDADSDLSQSLQYLITG